MTSGVPSDRSAERLVIATPDQLTVRQLHDILELRVGVFVVEQACPYPELDGRDLEETTRHVWLDDGAGRIASYLRVLLDIQPDGRVVQRIGRVVTPPWARGRGLAGQLIQEVLRRWPIETVLSAQSHLAPLYARHGFVVDGEDWVEDGIPHTPMRRRAD